MNNEKGPRSRGKKPASARIGRNVRYIMSAREINQVRLARELGLTESQMSRRISGIVDWTPEDLEITARILGVNIDRLFSKLMEVDPQDYKTMHSTAAVIDLAQRRATVSSLRRAA